MTLSKFFNNRLFQDFTKTTEIDAPDSVAQTRSLCTRPQLRQFLLECERAVSAEGVEAEINQTTQVCMYERIIPNVIEYTKCLSYI